MASTSAKYGKAYRPSAAAKPTPQTKIGSRSRVIPFVRIVIIVQIVLTPAAVVDTVKTRIANAKKSIPTPASSVIGARTTQPMVKLPTANVVNSSAAAATSVQRLRALSRGKAMSRAPHMIGMTKLPHGPATATISARIINIP